MDRDAIFFGAGLLFAIPASVAANLATPRVRDWLASSSESRLRKRIHDLKLQFEMPQMSLDWLLPRILKKLVDVLLSITVLVLTSIMPWLAPSPLTSADRWGFRIVVLLAVFATGYSIGGISSALAGC